MDIFKCQQCGDCCKGFGGTFVTEKEIEKIAARVDTDPKTFVEKYCQISGGKALLAQGKDNYCIFWDGLCSIHPVKPRMCKKWPFLEIVLVDITNWHIMASQCPGIRTDVPESTVKTYIAQELSKNS
jgi:Fe-S-cluster containining protein